MGQSLFGEKKAWRDSLSVVIAIVTAFLLIAVWHINMQQKSNNSSLVTISLQLNEMHRQFLVNNEQINNRISLLQKPTADFQAQQVHEPLRHNFQRSDSRMEPISKDVTYRHELQPHTPGKIFHRTGNDLNNEMDKKALQDIYEIYHSQRGDTCTGCTYVKPILDSIRFSSVLDAGAANCKVTRAFLDAGKSVKAVELSSFVLKQFCSDLLEDGTVYNAAVHELGMFSSGQFDFVFCADVLEHVPQANVDETLIQFSRVGSKYFFFVIHDAPAQKDKKSLTRDSKYKIHETVQPRSWWLERFAKFGMREHKGFRNSFLSNAKHTMAKELLSDKQLSRLYFMIKM